MDNHKFNLDLKTWSVSGVGDNAKGYAFLTARLFNLICGRIPVALSHKAEEVLTVAGCMARKG